MSGLMNIGLRSLLAYETALTINGQNVANVNTPYYSRRVTDFAESTPLSGVEVKDVRRIFDDSLADNLAQTNSELNMSSTVLDGCQELETILSGNDKNEIPNYIENAISALRSLSDQPADMNNRGLYLNQLNIMANRFNEIDGKIHQQVNSLNQSIATTTETVNDVVRQIADINSQMNNARSQNQDTSSLEDQQEALLQNLAQYTQFSLQKEDNGELDISIGNGAPLVVGTQYFTISTAPNASEQNNLDVIVNTGSGPVNVTQQLQGGQLNGLIQMRDTTLKTASQYLNRLALVLGDELNRQNKLGIDINGNLGGNIFNDINEAQTTRDRVIKNINNTGSEDMNVVIDNVNQLTPSDYVLQFDTATHYNLVRSSDNTIVSSGTVGSLPQQISADGFSINVNSGTVAAGDKFIISPTRNASANLHVILADNSLLACGWPIDAENNLNNVGTGKINVDSIVDTSNAAFSVPKQLNPPLLIKFLSDTSYEILNANDNSTIEGPLTYDPTQSNSVFPTPGGYDPGYRISLSGNIKAGDSFTVEYNSNASANPAGDNRNVMATEDLFNANTVENSMNFVQAYRFLSTQVSVDTNEAQYKNDSATILYQQSQSSYAQESGVSLHEEMVDMMNYQQAYQASSQIINAAKNVFDTILGLMGR